MSVKLDREGHTGQAGRGCTAGKEPSKQREQHEQSMEVESAQCEGPVSYLFGELSSEVWERS